MATRCSARAKCAAARRPRRGLAAAWYISAWVSVTAASTSATSLLARRPLPGNHRTGQRSVEERADVGIGLLQRLVVGREVNRADHRPHGRRFGATARPRLVHESIEDLADAAARARRSLALEPQQVVLSKRHGHRPFHVYTISCINRIVGDSGGVCAHAGPRARPLEMLKSIS